MTFEANIRDFGEKKLTIFSQKIVKKNLKIFCKSDENEIWIMKSFKPVGL